VVDGRRHQQQHAAAGQDDASEEQRALDRRRVDEVRLERRGQQEREQDLRPRQRDAELVQELDQLTVGSLLVGLGYPAGVPGCTTG
jgi:hypothetical protein